eukprot:125244_1
MCEEQSYVASLLQQIDQLRTESEKIKQRLDIQLEKQHNTSRLYFHFSDLSTDIYWTICSFLSKTQVATFSVLSPYYYQITKCFASENLRNPLLKHLNTDKGRKFTYFRNCSLCNKLASLRCSRCKKIYYCSRKCQKINWKYHKSTCGKQLYQFKYMCKKQKKKK